MLILIMPLFSVPSVKAQKTYLADLSKWDSVFKIPSFTVPTASITSRSTTDLFQFNITLSRLVAISSISISIETSNVAFYYQPPLNQELNGKEYEGWKINATHAIDTTGKLRIYRPLNVVGSYAVYSTTKRDNQYTTGKLFHIYRPLLIDAKGKTSWATLNITNNVLKIIANQTFLGSATYPVTVDPTFGISDIGGSSGSTYGGSTSGTKYNLPVDGLVSDVRVYGCAVYGVPNIHINTGIYDSTPSSLLSSGTEIFIDGTNSWHVVSQTKSLVAGDYWLAVGAKSGDGSDFKMYFDSGTSGQSKRNGDNYLPNTWSGGSAQDWIISIYATYTSGGQDLTFQLSQTIHATSSINMLKEKGYSLSETAHLTSTLTQQKELSFPLSVTVKATDSLTMNKEIAIIIHEWVYSLEETAQLTANLYTSLEIAEKVSLGIGFYIGVLALVIALMAYLRSRH